MNRRSLMAAIWMATLAAGVSSAQAKEEIRLAHHMPLTHHMHRGAEAIANYFNERSETHEIHVFGAGQLYSEKALVQAVQSGGVEMSFTTVGFWSGTAPGVLAMDYPGLLGGYDKGRAALEGAFGDALAEDISKGGVEVLGWLHFGTNSVIINNKHPVKVLADFAGLKLRTPNPMGAELFDAVGAASVVMSSTEVYMAMQRGTIDGTLTGSTAVTQRKFHEVGPYATYVALQYSAHPVAVNGRFWQSLPEDQQQLLREAVQEGSRVTAAEAEAEDKKALAEYRELIEVYEMPQEALDEIVETARPEVDAYLAGIAGDRGLELIELARRDLATLD